MTVNKRLQIKFVITTMIAVTLIVLGVFCVVTFENYKITNEQLDALLELISENNGSMPEKESKKYAYLADEAKYSTRYFTIRTDNKGVIKEVNIDNIASVSEEEAEDMTNEILKNSRRFGFFHQLANSILANKKSSGFFSNYKYKITSVSQGKLIVFIDCQMQLQSFKAATLRSLAVTGGALVVILFALIGFSKNILSPVFKSIESQKNFVTNASHEFKTPLAVVMADIDILEMTVGEDNEWLKSIKNQTNRLNTLTRTLLTLSNVQDGRASLVTSKFSINDLVSEVIEELKILIGDRKINFNKQLDAIMTADRDMMKQVVNILFDNAIKYTPEDGEINITTGKKGKNVKFEISNTCENAKEIDTSRLFERFYREDKSRTKKEGYGIGLSIAQSIVAIHKGRISSGTTKDGKIYFRVII
ncbi:MAG: HAMP domain-containing histidine kinase [Clostridia bacterium]|nr:HAMP domain-containing histidine kinase [Clostridia bacterium]